MNRSNSRSLSKLKRLGFDGAYLALLTLEGLKPLSRLENCSKAAFRRVLENVGLRTRVVRRWTRSGKLVAETIFGRSADTLAEYTAWFDNKPLRHNADDVRIEGRLFGYPTCCIESYVSHGYAANSISPADQRILFHWACPRCEVTPGLLPQYRQVYLECRRLFTPNGSLIGKPANAKSRYSRTTLAAIAASIAAVLGFPQSSIATSKMLQFDPHCLPLESGTDPDRDLIASEEEVILRFDPSNPDQNQNAIPDGADLARELADRIASLPDAPSTTGPYVIHHPAFGLEICKVCAETANMGFVTIVNPLENQAIDIPHIGLHYLAHGSFQFGGTVHEGRLNPPLLKMVVTSTGLGHFIPDPEAYDADADGLRDWEEPFFGTNPSTRDSNSNGVIDGAEVMRALKANLDALPRAPNLADGPKDTPFIVEHPMKGVETCPQCGERVGMNIWDVINPITNATMSIPSMALHYMLHCGPSWEGGVLMGGKGRVDPVKLRGLISGQTDGHWLEVRNDTDQDLLSDQEESDLRTDSRNADENHNGALDGAELAQQMAQKIRSLPSDPSAVVYRLDFQLRGLETCDVCGKPVNMGHATVCNTAAGLYAHLPYISLHYMDHGSFSFAGNIHGLGRIEVKRLADVLQGKGPTHLFPLPNDSDRDGLRDAEEAHFGFNTNNPDSDNDGVPDGPQLAYKMWSEIQNLPRTPNQRCYVAEYPQRGFVTCEVCGASVNMGWIEIVNPHEKLQIPVSYLVLHFLRNGTFSTPAGERINPCLLDIALHGDGSSHLVVVERDFDRDGLLDTEEPNFGTLTDEADSDKDGVLDGVEAARLQFERIRALPVGKNPGGRYRLLQETDCVTPCPICAESVNCGHVEVVNEWSCKSIRISLLNLHYIEHGSFAVSEAERVNAVALQELLKPLPSIELTAEAITLRWPSCTDYAYQVLTGPALNGPWTPGPLLQGTGSELLFTDPILTGFPMKLYQIRMLRP